MRTTASVILCTYNRAQLLRAALRSLAAMDIPAGLEWEVLIVDNNSSDNTREVAAEFSTRHSRFRYLLEQQQGKSYALNTGIRVARGEILAFADDDARVEVSWLRNLIACFQKEKYAGCGGRILLEWESERPRWLPPGRYALAPFASFDLGDRAGPLWEPPFGANMAFRREMFETYGGFREDLGPRPGSEIRSEDTEFGHRLLTAGETLWYEPSAVVYHPVPTVRLRKEYHLAWWYDRGRAEVREGAISPGSMSIRGVPLKLAGSAAKALFLSSIRSRPSERFKAKLDAWQTLGAIAECRRRAQFPPVAASASDGVKSHGTEDAA